MKKILLLIVISAIVASCVKMPGSDVDTPTGGVLNVPSNFDWKTVKELNVTVNVTAVSGYSDKVHIIRIYNSPLLNSSALIATGAAKPNSPYIVKLSVSAPVESLYIHETKPNGLVKVTPLEVKSSTLTIALNNNFEAAPLFTKSSGPVGQNASFTSPSITIPTGYDQIINNNAALNTLGFNTGESSTFGNIYKSYLIPAGFTRTADINFSNYRSHAIIYVQGTLNISGEIGLNNSSIVVLNGGRVTSGGMKTSTFANMSANPVPIIYIEQGAIVTSFKHISLSNTINAVNKGTLILDGNNFDLNMNTGSKLYNEGTVEVKNNKSEFLVTNSSQVYNSGIIKSPKIDMTVNATLYNDLSATVEVEIWYQSNGTILNNHGEVVATTKFSNSGGGTVNNFCRIAALETDLTQITANLEPGSLWNTQNFKVNNSNITMVGGSMFMTANVSNIFKMNVNTPSSSFALFKNTGNMPDLRWAQTSFTGNVEYVQTTLTEGTGNNGRGLYEGSFGGGAILTKDQTKNIPGTTCNGSLGQIDPGNGGGGGAPDPVFGIFFPSETGWGTYAFEDQWPTKGDYDLNDFVTAFRVSFYANSSNLITELHFDYQIMAVGATYNIAAGFQLNNVPASNVTLVTGQLMGGATTPFNVSSNGSENGVTTAVIPLFNNTKTVATYTGFLNTERGSYTSTEQKKVVVKFNTPVNQSSLSMESFNFFIVVNQRGREIHLPGSPATSKFDSNLAAGTGLHPTDKFKDANGMMWGLMFPEYFSYPLERKSIIDAYTHFATWATSGGAQYNDWFMNKEGYRKDELIY
jgi:LruC domain-containing protein